MMLVWALFASFSFLAGAMYFSYRRDQRRLQESVKPKGAPLSNAEINSFKRLFKSRALPAVELVPSAEAQVSPTGTSLGGPAWLADGANWPSGADEKPLIFVARINFAELPPISGFPTSGLLQFFIGSGDNYGVNFDDQTNGDFAVVWYPEPYLRGGGAAFPGPTPEFLPFQNEALWRNGITLTGLSTQQEPGSADWKIDLAYEKLKRRPGKEALHEILDSQNDKIACRHHFGGHPMFIQCDFRSGDSYSEYDRVLLRLTSDKCLIWGDAGEAVFMISAHDLSTCDFSRVAYHFDCS